MPPLCATRLSVSPERAVLLIFIFICILASSSTTSSGSENRRRTQESSARRDCRTIDASFLLADETHYFLSGDEYITYNMPLHSEEKRGKISRGLRGVEQTNFDAAFTYFEYTVFLLKGDQYYRYNVTSEIRTFILLVSGLTSELGLPTDVDAAVSSEEEILVFKGCSVYRLGRNASQFILDPNDLPSRGLPCDLNSAVEWEYGNSIYIKGAQIWDDEAEEPYHVDTLNICSWYICGEADWIFQRQRHGRNMKCNGDKRLCPMRLDQITMAGLHNAGAGFDGGFGSLLNCWARNHAQNITKQLQDGIRHLDIDPCHDNCGLVGTCHNMFCGGAICPMIKQVRHFLRENPHEVVSLYFNHDIVEQDKVFPALTRMLKTQFTARLLSKKFRQTGGRIWPTLRNSIRTGRRVYVFYPYQVERGPYKVRVFDRNLWIHSGSWIGSTWRPFNMYWGETCEGIVALSEDRCRYRRYRHLVEVSITPQLGSCVSTMAEKCRLYLHESLEQCQWHRYRLNKAPNILVVDYPEENLAHFHSVYAAVYHQNVRNIARLRDGECEIKVNASVAIPGTDKALLFVGGNILLVNLTLKIQVEMREERQLRFVRSAFYNSTTNKVIAATATSVLSVDPISLEVSRVESEDLLPDADDMLELMDSNNLTVLHYYRGCSLQPAHIPPRSGTGNSDTSQVFPSIPDVLPCDVDAAMAKDTTLIMFKGNYYWEFRDRVLLNEGFLLNHWSIDAVQCRV